MAQKTIAQITPDNNPTSDDVVAVWDYASNTTKRVSLAKLKSEIMQNNPYKFSVYNSGAQTLGTAATVVKFGAEEFDSNNNFDNVTNNTYTVPVSGFYYFCSRISVVVGSTAATSLLYLYKNGSSVKIGDQIIPSNSQNLSMRVEAFLQLTAGDTIAVYAASTSHSFATIGGQTQDYFMGYLHALT